MRTSCDQARSAVGTNRLLRNEYLSIYALSAQYKVSWPVWCAQRSRTIVRDVCTRYVTAQGHSCTLQHESRVHADTKLSAAARIDTESRQAEAGLLVPEMLVNFATQKGCATHPF